MFKKLMFLFNHLDVIDILIEKERTARIETDKQEKKDNLRLCKKHQQERNHSHFAEHNCDYCKLLNKVENVPNVPKPSSPPKIYNTDGNKLW
jgi:hypothetical protein